jgi:hypothetical protein
MALRSRHLGDGPGRARYGRKPVLHHALPPTASQRRVHRLRPRDRGDGRGRPSRPGRPHPRDRHRAVIARYVALLFIAAVPFGSARAALAQTVPFGKNKIQYRNFQWQVLAGEHVDVYHYPEEEELARLTLAYAEESFRVLERRFQHHPADRIPLIVYSSHHHFEQTNVFPGFIPEGVLGFTEYQKRRIALPFRGDYAQFRHTLRHELVHAFQLSKIQEVRSLRPVRSGFSPQQVHWWTEGLAEYWSSPQETEDEMFNRDLVLNGRVPGIREFTRSQSFASYPLGAELHRFLARRFGEGYILRVYEEFWKYRSFEETLEAVLGVDLDSLDHAWKLALQRRYLPEFSRSAPPEVAAVPVIYGRGGSFRPSLFTPSDGSEPQLLFYSARTGYMNIFRTPLAQGEEGVEVVVEGERTPEFEALYAFDSRIDVHPSGVAAFVSRYLERDALVLWDLGRDGVVGRYQWPDLVALKSPSWDPTGERIVFEGLSAGGYSDLYVLDFRTQQRIRLTADRYRDRDPDWSPDGRYIVFASDRTIHGADGGVNLYLVDPATGEVRPLTFGPWRDLGPRWSNDGSRIAFASDRTGTFDLYAVRPDGTGRRLTALAGGAFDPEWLPDDRGLLFTGYSQGTYRIYRFTIDADTANHEAIRMANVGDGRGEEAPVAVRPEGAGSHTGRGAETGWEWSELRARSLEDAEHRPYTSWRQISLDVAGGDAFLAPGLGAAQGAQFLATDMLGNHVLFTGLSAAQGSSLAELADRLSGNLFYLNLSHRLNFGAGVYRFKGRFSDVALDLYEDESYGGFLVAAYPFSKFSRVELQLGIEWSDRVDVENDLDDPIFGSPIIVDDQDLTRAGLLTTNFVAVVRDNTLWNDVGPIDGERYNLSAGYVACFSCTRPSRFDGEAIARHALAESYVLSVDYRRYFRTSTESAYALRLLGFFSDGAIPGRTILGGSHRLRGFPRRSLVGSRVGLLNQEWRFPLGDRIRVRLPFRGLSLPRLQGAIFADLGASWLKDQNPTGALGSYGVGLRAPIAPALVLRLDIGRRFRFGELPPALYGTGMRFEKTFVDFFFGYSY